jgi:hypothetical protein
MKQEAIISGEIRSRRGAIEPLHDCGYQLNLSVKGWTCRGEFKVGYQKHLFMAPTLPKDHVLILSLGIFGL